MSMSDEGHGSYVRRVAEETQRHVEELMLANHRLRVRVAALESDEARLEEQARSAECLLQQNELLRSQVRTLDGEKERLQEQVLDLCRELDRRRHEREQLRAELAAIESESQRQSEEHRELETQNSNLANLYVASYRLHGTLKRQEILDTIQEIVANLIGSEELAVFEMGPDAQLRLSAWYGIDPERYRTIPVGDGIIGRCAETGDNYVRGGGDGERALEREAGLTACIPLKLDGKVSGALALFRLLPQKSGIEALDHELFDLLATHAATALYCTSLARGAADERA